MILQVKQYLLDNWDNLMPGSTKPWSLSFLKVESRQSAFAALSFLVFVDRSEQPVFLLKTPRNPDCPGALQKEFSNLSSIFHKVRSLKDSIPRPVFLEDVDGHLVMLESALHGVKLEKRYRSRFSRTRNLQRYFGESLDWLVSFHRETEVCRRSFDQAMLGEYVTRPISEFSDNLDRESRDKLALGLPRISEKMGSYLGEQLPVVAEHGDFNPYNIIVSGKGLSLVDWEDCLPEALPFTDLLQYLTVGAPFVENRSLGPWLFEETTSPLYQRLAREFVDGYCSQMKVNPDLISSYYPVYLMRMANKELEPQRDNRGNFERWVTLIKACLSKPTNSLQETMIGA